jgi:hypothetical protein
MKIIKRLMEKVDTKNLYLVLTHCDQNDPDEKFIEGKIESMKKYGGVEIIRENTFKFFNT